MDRKKERELNLDSYRGTTIVLMVFYTLCGLFSSDLPFFAKHNFPRSFHFGDLILPMFLYSSGRSLALDAQGTLFSSPLILRRIGRRIFKLLLASFLLSFFFTMRLFAMDEIMLNLILFLPCCLFVRLPSVWLPILIFSQLGIHTVAQVLNLLPDFSERYLGGYRAAIWYLPIMVAGILHQKEKELTGKLIILSAATCVMLLWVSPPYKLEVRSSFIALSILWCILSFQMLDWSGFRPLRQTGRKPFRFWILQFLVFVIPVRMYCLSNGSFGPLPGIAGGDAVFLALLGTFFLLSLSWGLDRLSRLDLPILGQRHNSTKTARGILSF